MTTAHEIENILKCSHDGNVTAFVVMARACELAASNTYKSEDIANVMYETLKGFETIHSTEFPQSL